MSENNIIVDFPVNFNLEDIYNMTDEDWDDLEDDVDEPENDEDFEDEDD